MIGAALLPTSTTVVWRRRGERKREEERDHRAKVSLAALVASQSEPAVAESFR